MVFIVFFKKKSVKNISNTVAPEKKTVATSSVIENKSAMSPEDMATEFLLSELSENLQKLA